MAGASSSVNQTPESAPALDRPGTEITITDRTHALFSRRVKLVYRKCPGRRDHVLVELPSGCRRAVPVAATSLADHIPGLGVPPTALPAPISIRTLLPLAGLVRALKRRALEVPDAPGDCPTSADSQTSSGEGSSTADLVPAASRSTSTRGSRPRRARPTHSAGQGRSR